MHFLITFSFIK